MAYSLVPNPVIKPNVKQIAAEVVAATNPAVTNTWGGGGAPDHNNQRCVDYMTPSRERGQAVADYNERHAVRLGVRFMVWNRRVYRSYSKPGIPARTWAPYTGTSNPHTDHVHVEYDEKPYQPPKDPVKPPDVPEPPTDEKGIFGMSTSVYKRRTKDTPLEVKTSWTDLEVTDTVNSLSVVTGEKDDVSLMAAVYVNGLQGSEVVDFCWRIASYKEGTPTTYPHTRIGQRMDAGQGLRTIEVGFNGGIPKAESGRSNRLRFSYRTNSKTAKILDIQISGRTT